MAGVFGNNAHLKHTHICMHTHTSSTHSVAHTSNTSRCLTDFIETLSGETNGGQFAGNFYGTVRKGVANGPYQWAWHTDIVFAPRLLYNKFQSGGEESTNGGWDRLYV